MNTETSLENAKKRIDEQDGEIVQLKKLVRDQSHALNTLSLLLNLSQQPVTMRMVTELAKRACDAVSR